MTLSLCPSCRVPLREGASELRESALAPSTPLTDHPGGVKPLHTETTVSRGSYEFTVPGDPIPWAVPYRPKDSNKRIVPHRATLQADRIRMAWERLQAPEFPKGTPFEVECVFMVKRPNYHYGTGRNADRIKPRFLEAFPTARPDLDNLVKLVVDALSVNVWEDDDQVVGIAARKMYGASGQTWVTVRRA